MIGSVTVTFVQVTTTRDRLGNETYETIEQDVDGVMVEPVPQTEQDDPNGTQLVVTRSRFYAPVVVDLNADDIVLHAGYAWRVDGGSQVWVDQTVATAVRTSEF